MPRGTLGQIIPPSTVLIFMGDMLSGINSQVQMAKGNFAPVPVSVGDLFAGAILPGLMLVGLYLAYVIFKAITDPAVAARDAGPPEERATLWREVMVALVPPLLLIMAVLGSILGRHRHADRSGLGRGGGRDGPRGAALAAVAPRSCARRWSAPRRSPRWSSSSCWVRRSSRSSSG